MSASVDREEYRKLISGILLGRAIIDPKLIEKYDIKELTQQQAITAMLDVMEKYGTALKQELKQSLEARIPKPSNELTDMSIVEQHGYERARKEFKEAIVFVFQDKGEGPHD